MNAVSRISTVVGNWRAISTDVDVEAQVITGCHAPFTLPALPEQARSAAAPTRTPAPADEMSPTSNPVDDFFGITRPRPTRESRHDSYPSVSRVSDVISMDGEAPPPYAEGAELPAYTVAQSEPATLAMYLFKFGFLFPPFWILGAIILLSPLNAPAEFEPTKPEAERQELIRTMRETEIKWAKRCAWALLILIVVFAMMAGVVVAVVKSRA